MFRLGIISINSRFGLSYNQNYSCSARTNFRGNKMNFLMIDTISWVRDENLNVNMRTAIMVECYTYVLDNHTQIFTING